MSTISTRLVYEALEHYTKLGYQMLDVPMCVSREASDYTRPAEYEALEHVNDKVYVGSAEQGFIQLFMEGKLPNGKFMALTPCCRDEKYLSESSLKVFLKLELIIVGEANTKAIVKDATSFFNEYALVGTTNDEIVDILDIVALTELGSYGVRTFPNSDVEYTFGTGLAEPRLSLVIKMQNSIPEHLVDNVVKYRTSINEIDIKR